MKLKKVNYLTEEKFTQLVKGEIEGKTYNPNQEQYIIQLYDIVVETSGTMQTSTLPAMTVPKLTKEQVENIYNAYNQGGYVQVKDSYGNYAITEADVAGEEVRFTYFGVHIGYYIEGSNVVAVEIKEELYRHRIYNSYDEKAIYVYTTKSTELTKNELYNRENYGNGFIKAVSVVIDSPSGVWYAQPHFDMLSEFVTYYVGDISLNAQFQFWMDFETQEIIKV